MRLRHDERLFDNLFCVIVSRNTFEADLRFLTENTLAQLCFQLVVVFTTIDLIIKIETVEANLTLIPHIVL